MRKYKITQKTNDLFISYIDWGVGILGGEMNVILKVVYFVGDFCSFHK